MDRAANRARANLYYAQNREKVLANCAVYRKRNPEKIRLYQQRYSKENRKALNQKTRIYRALLRMEVFEHYGNKCACCGEDHTEFLEVDHENGNGNAHRRSLGITTSNQLHAWLKKNNYPEGFRLLCACCNRSIGFFGYCPHKEQRDFYAERIVKGFLHNHRGTI